MKIKTGTVLKRWQYLLLALLATCFYSCKDDDNTSLKPYDPSKPVEISDFIPHEGGAYQKLLIYGTNFGTDASKVKVTIGKKDAVVINVESTYIYCFVPSGAFTGEIEVQIGEGENMKTVLSETNFKYDPKMVVGTLCGFRNNRDDQGWRDGPFDGAENIKACGFARPARLAFDPLYPDHMYVCYDGHKSMQLVDIKKRTVTSPLSLINVATDRIRSIDFNVATKYSTKGQYMLISTDFNGQGNKSPSVYIIKRNEDGTFDDRSKIETLASYRDCNGATIHPKNGELYFNSYEKGQVFRLNLDDYFEAIQNGGTWNPSTEENTKCFKQLFTIADPSWEFQIFIHPTGKYAYFGVINNHYIMRSDYDEKTSQFVTPYTIAGGYKQSGYKDDVGAAARMNSPCQGVFVYNPEYAGQTDEYDFYFVDKYNFCVRKMTPDGIVSTYAGRGTSSALADNNQWGTDDGDLREVARFRDVCGLTYSNETFYIQDEIGRTIRTISMEKETTTESNE